MSKVSFRIDKQLTACCQEKAYVHRLRLRHFFDRRLNHRRNFFVQWYYNFSWAFIAHPYSQISHKAQYKSIKPLALIALFPEYYPVYTQTSQSESRPIVAKLWVPATFRIARADKWTGVDRISITGTLADQLCLRDR